MVWTRLVNRVGAGVLALTLAGVTLGSDTPQPPVVSGTISQAISPVRLTAPLKLDPAPTPSASPTPEPVLPEQPPNAKPPQYRPPAPAPPLPDRPPATTPEEAVAFAVDVGRSRGVRVGVAVIDRQTGTFYGGGDVDGQFASASVMKVFIATRLLVDGQAADPAIRDEMWRMIVASDDLAARHLYQVAGAESLIGWIVGRYGIGGLAPANIPNYWGLTRITARAVVRFYVAVAGDSAVAPWLFSAMASTTATAADGFKQHFGLPSVASSWKVKQGWMCCLENLTRMHSTGLISGDRYSVALLIEGSRSVYGNTGAQTLTMMARALLPAGTIPQAPPPPPPPPPPTPTPTPTPTPDPTPTPTPTPDPEPTEPPAGDP